MRFRTRERSQLALYARNRRTDERYPSADRTPEVLRCFRFVFRALTVMVRRGLVLARGKPWPRVDPVQGQAIRCLCI